MGGKIKKMRLFHFETSQLLKIQLLIMPPLISTMSCYGPSGDQNPCESNGTTVDLKSCAKKECKGSENACSRRTDKDTGKPVTTRLLGCTRMMARIEGGCTEVTRNDWVSIAEGQDVDNHHSIVCACKTDLCNAAAGTKKLAKMTAVFQQYLMLLYAVNP